MGFLNDLQTHEILGKVLNAGKDALKVDIDNATITAGSLEVNLDNANDDVLIYSNTAKDGSGTNYTPLLDSDGHLQVDVLSVTSSNVQGINAEGGALPNPVLIAGDDGTDLKNINVDATTGDVQVDVTNTVTVDGSGVTQPVSGTVTANLSATDNAVLDSIDSDTSAIKTAVEIIDNAISGSEMQVDVVDALPAGDNNIGNVDIASTPTTSATISGQSSSSTSYAALTGSNMTTDTHGIFSYVIQITGTDNCTLKVQGSNDNSNWVDDDMAEVTIATSASGLISGTTFFQYIRLQFKSSATNGTTVNGQGYAK